MRPDRLLRALAQVEDVISQLTDRALAALDEATSGRARGVLVGLAADATQRRAPRTLLCSSCRSGLSPTAVMMER